MHLFVPQKQQSRSQIELGSQAQRPWPHVPAEEGPQRPLKVSVGMSAVFVNCTRRPGQSDQRQGVRPRTDPPRLRLHDQRVAGLQEETALPLDEHDAKVTASLYHHRNDGLYCYTYMNTMLPLLVGSTVRRP